MARRGLNEDLASPPAKRLVITEQSSHRHILREREEIILHVVELKNPAIAPEVLSVFEQMPLVCGDPDRYPLRHGQRITLRLVTVKVRVQDPVDLLDPELAEILQHRTRAEVDQQSVRAI